MKKSTKIKTWAFFMRLGNRCGCHQREDRSFKIKGWQKSESQQILEDL